LVVPSHADNLGSYWNDVNGVVGEAYFLGNTGREGLLSLLYQWIWRGEIIDFVHFQLAVMDLSD